MIRQIHRSSFARRLFIVCACVTWVVAGSFSSPAVVVPDTVLWNNGDPGYFGGELLNEQSTDFGTHSVYDNFNVTDPAGWRVNRLWAYDDLTIATVTQVSWSVRSGMSAGHAGTLVASGTSAATQTLLGPSELQGYTKYLLQVTGLNFQLASGTYWLAVVPLVGPDNVNPNKKSYLDRTLGDNAVGPPAGNDGHAFLRDNFGGVASFDGDYSMGIAGVVVPEPASGALVVAGGLVLAVKRKRY